MINFFLPSSSSIVHALVFHAPKSFRACHLTVIARSFNIDGRSITNAVDHSRKIKKKSLLHELPFFSVSGLTRSTIFFNYCCSICSISQLCNDVISDCCRKISISKDLFGYMLQFLIENFRRQEIFWRKCKY